MNERRETKEGRRQSTGRVPKKKGKDGERVKGKVGRSRGGEGSCRTKGGKGEGAKRKRENKGNG